MLLRRVAAGFMAMLSFAGLSAVPANADTEKPPPGISAEAWRTRPDFPIFSAEAGPVVCFSGHLQDANWQSADCSDDGDWAWAGTEGEGRRLEAIRIVAYNTGGRTCAEAHGQNYGWQGLRCADDARELVIGTTGQSLQMEAFKFGHSTRITCNKAHIQNHGWQRHGCVGPDETRTAGTTGLSLRLEAATATIL